MTKIFLETYGCQMNEYDSELVKSILVENFEFCTTPEEADVVLLNTCAVRENAHNRIFGRIGHLKHLREDQGLKLGILGCMAQNLKENMLSNKSVDFIAGPDSYRSLPNLIETSLKTAKPKKLDVNQRVKLDLSEYETYQDIAPKRKEGVNAWIAIMRGCNNFCSFCVVPMTRGRERSRALDSIVLEAEEAVASGFPQITVLGQNVNSYKDEHGHDFATLMDQLAQVKGLKRVRFTSPHPKDFPEPLLKVISEHSNLCKQVHLPLQAGNSEILKRMRRGYTKEEFLKIAERIRTLIPGVFISTDIICGFPGETAEQFEETAEVMREVKFESAFIFKYSPREGTWAKEKFEDDVEDKEKGRRTVLLNEIQHANTSAALSKLEGSVKEVLIEDIRTPLSESQCQGKTDEGVTVVLPQDGSIKAGDFVNSKITSKTSHVLIGEFHDALAHVP